MQVNINNICGVKFRIHNKHNETFKRGSVLISNHQSILDPIIMLALSPHILVLISEKVWNNPIVHPLFKLAGFINLNQPMDSLKAKISDAVEKGYNVVIFPEGKRSWSSVMDPLKPGSFKLAIKAGAPIVPVTIEGTYKMFEENERITPGQSSSVWIHKPIETAGLSRKEQAEIHTLVEEIIRSKLPNKGYPEGDEEVGATESLEGVASPEGIEEVASPEDDK